MDIIALQNYLEANLPKYDYNLHYDSFRGKTDIEVRIKNSTVNAFIIEPRVNSDGDSFLEIFDRNYHSLGIVYFHLGIVYFH